MDKADKNFLSKQQERQAKIEAIVDKIEMNDVISHAEMGSGKDIQDRFFRVPPQFGGFADLAQHEDLVEECNSLIVERLEEAQEKGEIINDWSLYESVGKQVRKENLEFDEEGAYGLYREPPVTVEDQLQDNRSEAIKAMAKARGKEG